MASYTVGAVAYRSPGQAREIHREAGTIRAVRITVYLFTFLSVIGIAATIALLSIVVAPLDPKQDTLTLLAIAMGGLGVAGGVVYLAEKLINLAKGVGLMVFELIVEKYREHRYETGRKKGQKTERTAWLAWYERQQAALRNGKPFNEPPPGYSPESGDDGKGAT